MDPLDSGTPEVALLLKAYYSDLSDEPSHSAPVRFQLVIKLRVCFSKDTKLIITSNRELRPLAKCRLVNAAHFEVLRSFDLLLCWLVQVFNGLSESLSF